MRKGNLRIRGGLAVAWLLIAGLVFLIVPMVGCELLEWQALKVYMAVNPNLVKEDGPTPYETQTERIQLVTVVEGLEFPWDLAFVDDQTVYVTEKPGRLSRVDLRSGELSPIRGVPEVAFIGQGGLLGLRLDPAFAENGLLYFSHSIQVGPELYTTRVSRAQLVGDELRDVTPILTAEPALPGIHHFGGALEFDDKGFLLLSVGDRKERADAQDLGSFLGKIHRIETDGSTPEDNPFRHKSGARPEIMSWGHRNPQGIAVHPETGGIWAAEHGPKGGDEINRIEAGRNYGWPIISHGEEYSGGPVGVGSHQEGLEQPVHYYVPSIATSGLGIYTGDTLPSWKGNLFVGGLIGTQLSRVSVRGREFVGEEPLFKDLWHRVRAIQQSPGSRDFYMLTENGSLIRIEPAPSTQ